MAHDNKSPAFQFYPKDYLTDVKQIAMSLAESGAYWRLCCHCWLEGGLPADLMRLARLCGATSRQMQAMWPAISPCFVERDGRLYQKRLEREREKQQTFSRRQSDRSAHRWPRKDASQTDAESMPESSRIDAGLMPDACSSSSSSSASAIQIAPPAHVSVDPEIAEKAGRFLESYPVIYAEERRGAHFQLKPVLHYAVACDLVRGWPDEQRLALMFRTFCQLPSSEKMAWPGTPAQFLHLAPEIDVRLRQQGV